MKNKIDEATVAANIPEVRGPSGIMPCGSPYFSCNDNEELFWNLHRRKRKNRQWYKTHYKNEEVTKWARKNKNKNFYLKLSVSGVDMFRKIKNK